MEFMLPDLAPALPEMVLLAMACVVLLVDLFWPGRERSNTYVVSQLSLLATLLAVAQGYHGPVTTFSGHYTVDAVAVVIKVVALLIMFGVFLYGRDYLRQRALLTGEFLLLSLFATLGLLVMASAGSLLVLYLGLEVLSLSSYALVALHRDNGDASEAAIKYFFLGALASGLLLYGMSLLYGLTASLDLSTVAQVVGEHARAGDFSALMGLALAMLVVGIGFKLGIAPFHMWLPDVYHGAPTAVTAFLTTISKLAAFVLVVKLLAGAAAPLVQQWQQMLVVVTVLSLAVGNLVAIAQVNIKRMLAYSTISHMGFFLLGILANSPAGMAASLFYMITYALTGLAAFGMIMLLSRAGFEADRIEDFRGLNRRSPWLALVMMVILFSLAGVPPTVGFYAKLGVIRAVMQHDLLWLAIIAVIFSVIGAFYYLRVIKAMYFDAPEEQPAISPALDVRVFMGVNGALLLGLGVFPAPLLALCQAVF
ncbi:MAG: NADH-quinone oxidoreductase subunit NuoN [Immundisolibacter sp.]|uniref:NADH-quinone oxidoreductase subunit NuoN n=1 Tax=Immundisolibacter sp. TaxID=1934948 RepID=UPI0019A191CC|nr:NADH-quinone oxidoreductase subunit NuoN [Immundisolibacter sp.]MBC7162059.1 NADH-quinone oxidoreductase subunit NuoN [Immundisolibacter sp.]